MKLNIQLFAERMITFEDLPSTNTPLTAENLNNNFDYLLEDAENLNTTINKMQTDITGITTPITWDSTITKIENTENSIRVNKAEKSCVLTFAVNKSNAFEGAFTIGSFDMNYAPKQLIIGNGIVSSTGLVSTCQLSIDTNGNININNTGHSSNTFRGQIKWYY